MITWNTEIINRLKKGSINSVLLFGDDLSKVKPPYIVVKPIGSESRKLYQIFVHDVIGTQDKLESYVLTELPELLKEPLKKDNFRTTVKDTRNWTGPYTDEGDNTLAMTRDFYIPIIL